MSRSMSVQHLLLTGPPGVGKTTVIKNVTEELRKKNLKIEGFYTEENRIARERVGFDIVTLSGKRNTLARLSSASCRGPKVGKYTVNVSSFENLALPVFDCKDLDLLVLDEIGKMELFSKSFAAKTREAFSSSNTRILATIPVREGSLRLVDELRSQKNCTLIQVSKENRNELPSQIIQILIKSQ